jgi:hypothetical protein
MDLDLAAQVNDVLEIDAEAFQTRVEEDASVIKEEVAAGTFDNPQAIIGFEYEFYAVADAEGRHDDGGGAGELMRVPRRLLELIGFEKELGLHNAEMSTSPQPLNQYGLAAQEAEVRARLQTAQECVGAEGMRLVSDGMWTIPPEGESAREYLTNSIRDGDIAIATNMSDSVRYHAMANRKDGLDAGMRLDAPHVSLQADTVMPESLITSIQPHYQVAQARDLPQHFRYALRFAGPLLALGVNAPFFPADLYDEDATTEEILDDAWMENRISVFETALNPATGEEGKVRFPRDIDSVEDAIDSIVEDSTLVPMPVSASDRFDDKFAHFRMKHGTYWRWVRPVFGGPTRSAANARIEFRPIPAQPTVRDSIAFQAMFAGLMESLPRREHPVADLDWQFAEENFYAAVRDGLDADMRWITNDGRETTDLEAMYEDIFAHAKDGLKLRGLSDEEAAKYLWPLRMRARHRMTPAQWKHDEVSARVKNGDSFADALSGMQREYMRKQKDTLIEGTFAKWADN